MRGVVGRGLRALASCGKSCSGRLRGHNIGKAGAGAGQRIQVQPLKQSRILLGKGLLGCRRHHYAQEERCGEAPAGVGQGGGKGLLREPQKGGGGSRVKGERGPRGAGACLQCSRRWRFCTYGLLRSTAPAPRTSPRGQPPAAKCTTSRRLGWQVIRWRSSLALQTSSTRGAGRVGGAATGAGAPESPQKGAGATAPGCCWRCSLWSAAFAVCLWLGSSRMLLRSVTCSASKWLNLLSRPWQTSAGTALVPTAATAPARRDWSRRRRRPGRLLRDAGDVGKHAAQGERAAGPEAIWKAGVWWAQ